jgi:hypothetical protein
MPLVWKHVDFEEYEGNLKFSRINNIGEHDPQNFYYIWKVSKKK